MVTVLLRYTTSVMPARLHAGIDASGNLDDIAVAGSVHGGPN
jgi:hypothetical protein